MIKFEHAEVVGWEHVIRGMRNPKNSWARIDSYQANCGGNCEECDDCDCQNQPSVEGFVVGSNDHDLMMRLAKGGPVHAKYRRMITVYVDITAPLYW